MRIVLALSVLAALVVSAAAEAAPAAIPGLSARTLEKHFKRLDMVCSGPAKKSGVSTWTCTKKEGSSRFVVTIVGRSATEVTRVRAKASLRAAKPNPLAMSFLGYMAAIPYRGATPLKAREWARKHVGGGKTKIKGVTFVVTGTPKQRQLDMTA